MTKLYHSHVSACCQKTRTIPWNRKDLTILWHQRQQRLKHVLAFKITDPHGYTPITAPPQCSWKCVRVFKHPTGICDYSHRIWIMIQTFFFLSGGGWVTFFTALQLCWTETTTGLPYWRSPCSPVISVGGVSGLQTDAAGPVLHRRFWLPSHGDSKRFVKWSAGEESWTLLTRKKM